jgi:mannose-6-phosphate isomerase-like protein (cupin superfamily)
MFMRDVRDCTEIIAGDGTRLRELFNPLKDKMELRYSFAVATIAPGETSLLHRLKHSEVYYFLAGRGEMQVGGDNARVRPGQVVYVPPGGVQKLRNTGEEELMFICIVDPAWREEDEEVLE